MMHFFVSPQTLFQAFNQKKQFQKLDFDFERREGARCAKMLTDF